MLNGFQNASRIPELRRRPVIHLGHAGGVSSRRARADAGHRPTSDGGVLRSAKKHFFGFLNLFSGGALEQFSVFSLGIMPYISASIILAAFDRSFSLFRKTLERRGNRPAQDHPVHPLWHSGVVDYSRHDDQHRPGRDAGPGGHSLVLTPGWGFRLMTVITLTSGTAFIMWLGEQITERGIGNGISLIIFAGIVARLPSAVTTTLQFMREGELGPLVALLILALSVLVVGAIIFVERGQRRIPVQYAKRVVGRKMYGGMTSHLPLKINTANVIPPIFRIVDIDFSGDAGAVRQPSVGSNSCRHVGAGELAARFGLHYLIIFFAFFILRWCLIRAMSRKI